MHPKMVESHTIHCGDLQSERFPSFSPFSFLHAGISHDSPRTPNVHIRGSRPSNTPPKFHEKTPREREKKNEHEGGRGKKKREILGPSGPHPSGPTLRPPTLRPPTFQPLTLQPRTLLAPTFSRFWAPYPASPPPPPRTFGPMFFFVPFVFLPIFSLWS